MAKKDKKIEEVKKEQEVLEEKSTDVEKVIVDTPQEPVKKIKKEVSDNVVAKQEKSDVKKMEEFFAKQPKVRVIAEKWNSKPNCKVKMKDENGKFKEFLSYGEPVHFNINGYHFYIPRGQYVYVPEAIAKELEDNERLIMKGKEMALENIRGMEALSNLNTAGENSV